MALMTNWNVFISIAIISTLVKESHACFTHNVTNNALTEESGTSYYKECICTDKNYKLTQNATNLYWLGPGDKIIEKTGPGSGNKVYMERGENMISLSIPSLSKSLAGIYKCVFQDKDGRQHVISHEVDVYEPVYFIPANITPQFLVNGQDSLIHCSARGHELPLIRWYKGEEIEELSTGDKYKILSENGLLIKNASKEDEAQYVCKAEVPKTGEFKNAVIKVEVLTPPKVEGLIASKAKLMKDDPLTLICEASGYPLPTYYWRKVPVQETSTIHILPYVPTVKIPATKISSTETSINYENTALEEPVPWKQEYNKIVFESVSIEDHGKYECIAQNKVGKSIKEIDIVVEAAPNITEFQSFKVEEGKAASVSCTAIGRPRPQINITYFETPTEYPFKFSENTDDSTIITFSLEIEKVQWYHQGEYNCSATNSVGSDERSMILEVLYKPFFEKSYELIWVYNGDPLVLTCDEQSNPAAKIQWSFQGNKDFVENPQKLNVSNPNDGVTKWNNIIQYDQLSLWVALVGNATKNILTINAPKDKIYNGMYECTASNYLGTVKKQFVVKEAFLPDILPREQITVADVAATSVTFDIQNKTADDAPPLLGYTAEYDELENYNITDIHVNRSWAFNAPYKISKLKPMTTYKIRFATLNSAGSGPYGEYLNFTTPEKSAPEPPELSEDINSGPIPADKRILKLKDPEHNGDPIDYYAVKYCRMNTLECQEQTVPPTTELDLNHLTPNTTYMVEILAHNSMGNSTSLHLKIIMDADQKAFLTPEATIGIAVVVVIFCILVMDVLLYFTLKKGMINTCLHKKNKKKKDENKQTRDKKGLLKDKEASDPLKRPDNGHKEFEYNKSTGVITGKHSAV